MSALKIIVGIATRGRPLVLIETIADLSHQTRTADRVIVAYAEDSDIGDARDSFPEVTFVQSSLGLTRQRNAVLNCLNSDDIVLFLDDDFYLDSHYIDRMEVLFLSQPDVAVATGLVLADGINGPGLKFEDAKAILASNSGKDANAEPKPVFNAYGCNMALRVRDIKLFGLRFDENLPLYGWYEDVDFSRQLAQYGRVVQLPTAHGVHLGAKSGRQSGLRLGYSQIANPSYLARKQSVSWLYACSSMLSRSLKNLVRSISPEPFVDRRGRLRGNLRAWRDLVTGKIDPSKIQNF